MDANPYAPPKSGNTLTQSRRHIRARVFAMIGCGLIVGASAVGSATLFYLQHASNAAALDAKTFEEFVQAARVCQKTIAIAGYAAFIGTCLAIGSLCMSEAFQKAITRIRRDKLKRPE